MGGVKKRVQVIRLKERKFVVFAIIDVIECVHSLCFFFCIYKNICVGISWEITLMRNDRLSFLSSVQFMIPRGKICIQTRIYGGVYERRAPYCFHKKWPPIYARATAEISLIRISLLYCSQIECFENNSAVIQRSSKCQLIFPFRCNPQLMMMISRTTTLSPRQITSCSIKIPYEYFLPNSPLVYTNPQSEYQQSVIYRIPSFSLSLCIRPVISTAQSRLMGIPSVYAVCLGAFPKFCPPHQTVYTAYCVALNQRERYMRVQSKVDVERKVRGI